MCRLYIYTEEKVHGKGYGHPRRKIKKVYHKRLSTAKVGNPFGGNCQTPKQYEFENLRTSIFNVQSFFILSRTQHTIEVGPIRVAV